MTYEEIINEAKAEAVKSGCQDSKDFLIGYLAQKVIEIEKNRDHFYKLWLETLKNI